MAKKRLQDLPPSQAHFCLQSVQFLEEIGFNLAQKKLLIALSGGVDSSAVLLFLACMREKYELELFALHIDHSLRIESADEALHVENLCRTYDIPCKVIKKDVRALAKEWKKGIEESARIVRYSLFEEERSNNNLDYIVFGHHLNDLAEDALMRQIRGAGLEESVGMPAFDEKRKLIRPFLCTEKATLIDFVKACDIEWVDDSSNNSSEYMRNRVRNTILPNILEENPAYLKNVQHNWKQGQCDRLYWLKRIEPFLPCDKALEEFKLDRKAFAKEEKALRLRILVNILKKLGSHPQAELLFKLDLLITANESNKEVNINKGLNVKIQREFVLFTVSLF